MTAPAPRAPQLPVTFRPSSTRAVLLSGGVAVCAAITAVALRLPGTGAGERGSFIVCGLLILAAAALLSRPRLTADPDGVTVVNITSSRRLAWPEIIAVNLRAGDSWVFLDLADGSSLPVLAIQTGIARQRAVRDARALRALVERRATGADPAAGDTADSRDGG